MGRPSLAKRRIPIVIEKYHVATVQRYCSVWPHANGQDIPHQLIVLVERTRKEVDIAWPAEQARHVTPICNSNFGQGTSFCSSSLARVGTVAVLGGVVGVGGRQSRAGTGPHFLFRELAFNCHLV